MGRRSKSARHGGSVEGGPPHELPGGTAVGIEGACGLLKALAQNARHARLEEPDSFKRHRARSRCVQA